MEFNKIYIPYVGRDKYPDNRKYVETVSSTNAGGGIGGG